MLFSAKRRQLREQTVLCKAPTVFLLIPFYFLGFQGEGFWRCRKPCQSPLDITRGRGTSAGGAEQQQVIALSCWYPSCWCAWRSPRWGWKAATESSLGPAGVPWRGACQGPHQLPCVTAIPWHRAQCVTAFSVSFPNVPSVWNPSASTEEKNIRGRSQSRSKQSCSFGWIPPARCVLLLLVWGREGCSRFVHLN